MEKKQTYEAPDISVAWITTERHLLAGSAKIDNFLDEELYDDI